MAKEKKVLIDLGHVRITEGDRLNVIVEGYEEVFDNNTGNHKRKWQFKGYAPTVYKALKLISHYEWLIDNDLIKDLNSHLEQVQVSNDKLAEVLDVKEHIS